tara:strand:+ start:139 stop:243 length:105 start_codon:yes stop_codon:yes gene_type:complete
MEAENILHRQSKRAGPEEALEAKEERNSTVHEYL